MSSIALSMRSRPPSEPERRAGRQGSPEASTSWASTPAIRKTMQGCRSRDTAPEVALRSAVHRLGLRFFVARRPIRDLRATADLVFPTRGVAVFMDGCFWHGCPEHGEMPVRNATYWRTKIEANRQRDREVDRALAEHGWWPVRVWEHVPPKLAAEEIRQFLERIGTPSEAKARQPTVNTRVAMRSKASSTRARSAT
jgi:DNA mismatch endonuclease (patch repair protein)